jgi:hypothetical protein
MPKKIFYAVLISLALCPSIFGQKRPIPPPTLLQIVKAEDERRWDDVLRKLLSDRNPSIRKRAALAAGRIGNEDAVNALTPLLEKDTDVSVRSMGAFALGEIESEKAANALIAVRKNPSTPTEVSARALEALGKIAAALPREQEARQRELGAAILEGLDSKDPNTILFGLTAALRSRPAGAGPAIAKFLRFPYQEVRAAAANALARLRLKDGNEQLRTLLASDRDPIVRANAARVLGVTEDKQSFEAFLTHVVQDEDSRVRVSAIRALASLKDPRAVEPLFARGQVLTTKPLASEPPELNEILEIATTLGRLLAQKEDQKAITWLRKINESLNHTAPEIDLALVRIAPAAYLAAFGPGDEARKKVQETILLNWNAAAGIAAGLGEIAALPDSTPNKSEYATLAQSLLRAMLDYRNSILNMRFLTCCARSPLSSRRISLPSQLLNSKKATSSSAAPQPICSATCRLQKRPHRHSQPRGHKRQAIP